jgi:hypothetical protein
MGYAPAVEVQQKVRPAMQDVPTVPKTPARGSESSTPIVCARSCGTWAGLGGAKGEGLGLRNPVSARSLLPLATIDAAQAARRKSPSREDSGPAPENYGSRMLIVFKKSSTRELVLDVATLFGLPSARV